MPESEQQALIKVELKYCEACGGLWLRPAGSLHPYCEHCTPIIAGLNRAVEVAHA